MRITFHGAAREVTGSCFLVVVGVWRVLFVCCFFLCVPDAEAHNREAFPFNPQRLEAVIVSHAHHEHSGRLPLLIKAGYRGPVYTPGASRDLARIQHKDAGFLNEKDAE